MALTSGAKKFLGLLATVAVVGAAIYAFKQNAGDIKAKFAKEQTVQVQEADEPVEPYSAQVKQAEIATEVVEPITRHRDEVQETKHDASINRGLANVLNSGSK
jgi:Sec-independent protein translocase protein TatA